MCNFVLLLIRMGPFIYWVRFIWHWQHCTVRKNHSDNVINLLCILLFWLFLVWLMSASKKLMLRQPIWYDSVYQYWNDISIFMIYQNDSITISVRFRHLDILQHTPMNSTFVYMWHATSFYYVCQGHYVMPSVCLCVHLSVCLLAALRTNY